MYSKSFVFSDGAFFRKDENKPLKKGIGQQYIKRCYKPISFCYKTNILAGGNFIYLSNNNPVINIISFLMCNFLDHSRNECIFSDRD
jgi:hypothetical protein